MNSPQKVVEIPETIGYARVSSREQAENSAALKQPIARLKSAGVELGREGKEADRPNFQKLIR